ncbi:MAG: hypothetical protein LBH43_21435 [Treponema sp.]|jgi:hypothetical protein|nr:hypothetical protein [Treponema sp.]
MHLQNDLPFDFSVIKDPQADLLNLELKLREKADLIVPFINYMLGLDMGSVEYNKLKYHWQSSRNRQAGYFQALHDLVAYWNEYKTAIRGYKLSGYDGVSFLLKKLQENRQKLYYQGEKLDIEITRKEIESFKNKKKKKL